MSADIEGGDVREFTYLDLVSQKICDCFDWNEERKEILMYLDEKENWQGGNDFSTPKSPLHLNFFSDEW